MAQHLAWAENRLPPREMVAPGTWSVPIPAEGSTIRYTNVYVVECSDGLTLIDAGWDGDESWGVLSAGLGKIGFEISDVRRVLVTHAHRDHYGAASRIRATSGAVIAMHNQEARLLADRIGPDLVGRNEMLNWLVSHGVPVPDAPGMLPRALSGDAFDAPLPDIHIEDGALVDSPGRHLRAVWTPGHTPGHLCFIDEERNLLFSGDHVLPRITTNVSLRLGHAPDPLSDFLSSLAALTVGDVEIDEVLPAHEYRFKGLRTRVAQLEAHHDLRFREVLSELSAERAMTAWELSSRMTWSRGWEHIPSHLRRLALGETLAHLTFLARESAVEILPGDGLVRWRCTAS